MINVDLFFFINHGLQNPLFDLIMPFLTELGSFVAMLGACVIVFILSIILKKQKVKKIAILCLFSLLLGGLVAFILKAVIFEPRPFITFDNVRLLVAENDPCAFPSGHTTSTFAVISLLVFKLRDKLWSVILILFAIAIGFSRIYVGVHYPFDVLAGMIIGILAAYFTYRFDDKILNLYDGVVGVFKK